MNKLDEDGQNLAAQNDELKKELSKTRIWLQEMLCVLMNGITFEGFLNYCDAYDLDAETLLANEARYCDTDPIEVDWSVAMARDIWDRAGFQREQELLMEMQNGETTGTIDS